MFRKSRVFNFLENVNKCFLILRFSAIFIFKNTLFISYMLYLFSFVENIVSSSYLYILEWKWFTLTMYLPINRMDGFWGDLLIFSCMMLGSSPKIYTWLARWGKFILVITQKSGRNWRCGTSKQGNFFSAWFILCIWGNFCSAGQLSIASFFSSWLPLKKYCLAASDLLPGAPACYFRHKPYFSGRLRFLTHFIH